MGSFVPAALLISVLKVVMWPWLLRSRRRIIADLREHPNKVTPKGDGLIHTHRVLDIFDSTGICGSIVNSIGGPGAEATCNACQRMWRKAHQDQQ